MKRLAWSILCLACLFHAVTLVHALPLQKKRLVRVGVSENPPQVFSDDLGRYRGLDIDILEYVAQKEGWQLQYVPGSWNQCLTRLRAGTIDLQVAIAHSAKRARQFAFNREPIFSNWGQFFAPPGNTFTSILSLDKKTLALVKKDIHAQAFTKLARQFDLQPTYILVDSYKEALQRVSEGIADAGLTNRLYGNLKAADLGLVRTPVIFNPIEIHFAAPLHARDLLDTIDLHLKRLKKEPDSLYYQAIDRWLNTGTTPSTMPGWVMPALKFMAALLLAMLAIFLYAQHQIKIKTVELRQLLQKETKLRAELAKSEEKFRLAFHISPDAITLSDANGRLVEVNDGFCASTGYSRDEVIGRDPVQLGLWKNPEQRDHVRSALLKEKHVDLPEVEFIGKDGQKILARVSAVRFEFDGSLYFLSICHDISQFKAQQKALQEAEQQWRQTFDAITDLITVQDKDHKILLANRAARAYFKDLKPGDRACLRRNVDTKIPCPGCPVAETFTNKAPRSTVVHVKGSGRSFLVSTHPIFDGQGQPHQVVLIARDISEQISLEKERILLAVAIEQATESVIITDPEARILYVNKAFEKNTGYARAEVMGENPRFLKSGHHGPEFYQQMWDTLLAGGTWHGRLRNRRKNGEILEEEASISPVFDGQGRLINYIAVNRDITHERELEQQLQQAQKLEAIGTLASGIAHDFNNILGAILGFAEMASMQLAKDHPAREDIDNIVVACRRAVDLVKQILTFSRQDQPTLQPVQLQYLLKESIKLLTASLPATITLRHDIDTSCPAVLGDPTQLHQVILNLCTNARHAIGNNQGTITISLRQQKSPPHNMPATDQGKKAWLLLEVGDDGRGMEPEVKERIFDPFFTTKEKDKGTGLGLAVTHGIIQQHQGTIQVTSSPGKGATFRIFLPVFKATETRELEKTGLDLPGGREHIALVDDEYHLADIYRRILIALGYQVSMFTSAVKALAFLKNHINDIDLLLTDMTMPGMTGADLARQALAPRPDLPIILCTGFSEAIDQREAKRLGIRAFLLKPLSQDELARTVDNLLHRC